jgi:ABC-type amino acid transport system permease subunit
VWVRNLAGVAPLPPRHHHISFTISVGFANDWGNSRIFFIFFSFLLRKSKDVVPKFCWHVRVFMNIERFLSHFGRYFRISVKVSSEQSNALNTEFIYKLLENRVLNLPSPEIETIFLPTLRQWCVVVAGSNMLVKWSGAVHRQAPAESPHQRRQRVAMLRGARQVKLHMDVGVRASFCGA